MIISDYLKISPLLSTVAGSHFEFTNAQRIFSTPSVMTLLAAVMSKYQALL